VDALPLPEAFIGGKEEGPPAANRPTRGSTKLIPVEGVRIRRGELEEVARIEDIVSKEPEQVAAQAVGARTGDDVGNGSRHVTGFSVERRAVDLELLDAANRRLEDEGAERQVVGRDAVDHESNGFLTI